MHTTPSSAPRTRPLRVAYVLGGLPFGGIERWLLDLCREYHDGTRIVPRVFNLSGTGALAADYTENGVDVCNVAQGLRAITVYRLDTALALRRQLRAFAPDIVHTCHFSANHLGRLANLGTGIPLLLHLHNTKREKRLERRLSDKVLSYATSRYLAVSKAVAQTVAQDHNIAGRPVDVLYNAIEPSRFTAAPVDLAAEFGGRFGSDGPVVLSTGRYVPQKNYDLLIRAMGLLRDAGVTSSLVLVGEGPERPRLEALRAELGLEKHVVLAGFREDVARFYAAADVFAAPSAFEGFLISQLEAMYCGLPCVVSRHVPLLEIASSASLVCETNAEDIAAKLHTLLTDPQRRASLSETARRVAAPHTMQNYATALYTYYLAMLGERTLADVTATQAGYPHSLFCPVRG